MYLTYIAGFLAKDIVIVETESIYRYLQIHARGAKKKKRYTRNFAHTIASNSSAPRLICMQRGRPFKLMIYH